MNKCSVISAPDRQSFEEKINAVISGVKLIRTHYCYTTESEPHLAIIYYKETKPKESVVKWDNTKFEFAGITQKMIDEWSFRYSHISVQEELRRMTEWGYVNQEKIKHKDCDKFITGWLNRNNKKVARKTNVNV